MLGTACRKYIMDVITNAKAGLHPPPPLMDPAPPGGAAPRAPSSSGLDPTHASLYVATMRRIPHTLGLRVGCGQRWPRAAGGVLASGRPALRTRGFLCMPDRLAVASPFLRRWPPCQCGALHVAAVCVGGGWGRGAPAHMRAFGDASPVRTFAPAATHPRRLLCCARLRPRPPDGPRAPLGLPPPAVTLLRLISVVCVCVCVRAQPERAPWPR